MKIGSLFSGYGGLDLAVEQVFGATPAWFVEFDANPSKVLATHFPDVPNYGDVTAVDWSSVEPVDILTGGFPCQDLSHAGKRLGLRPGTRSGLWEHMAFAISELRPKIVVIENVRGLLSAWAHCELEPCSFCLANEQDGVLRALGAVLGDLAELGYDARWGGVRAADAGAPHGRFRVFVVAYPANNGLQWGGSPRTRGGGFENHGDEPLALLPTPTPFTNGNNETPEEWLERRADVVQRTGTHHGLPLAVAAVSISEGKPILQSDPMASLEETCSTPAPSAATTKVPPTAPTASDPIPLGSPESSQSALAGQQTITSGLLTESSGESPTEQLLPTPTVQDGENNGWPSQYERNSLPLNAIVTTDFGPYAAAVARWEATLGRPAPAPTEPGTNGQPRLSPAFVEWMMGLPAGWVTDTGISRNAQLKCLGNGVVPQQAALALRMLLGAA